jgi:hypothetical protein
MEYFRSFTLLLECDIEAHKAPSELSEMSVNIWYN